MPPAVAITSLLLFGGALVGLATDTFDFSLGSFLIWGGMIMLSLALLSRWFVDAEIIGLVLSWVYIVIFAIWLVQLIF